VADTALVIGWTRPVRGREPRASTVFGEGVALWTKLQGNGAIESWEAFFLEPHGGDLGGFFLLRGERDRLAALRSSEEFDRFVGRAMMVVDGLGVVAAATGPRIAELMERFQANAAELA